MACWFLTMYLPLKQKLPKKAAKIAIGEKVDKRERLTSIKFWESVDEDIEYSGKQLDKDIVNLNTDTHHHPGYKR